ncbi:sentrin-specific protease 6 isoform 2-T2 [Rhinophrynus dorsalis]
MAGGGDSRFLEALERAQTKKDAGFRSNWSFDHSEDSEDEPEKDEANLLSLDESDEADAQITEQKAKQLRTGTCRALGDPIKTYERRVRPPYFRPLRGNAIGLNMLGASKRENSQNIGMATGTMVQGRLFHHTSIPRSTVKTAAQRKEYPAHVQKVETDANKIHPSQRLENLQERREEPDFESEPEIRRKVQQKRRSNLQEPDLSSLHSVCLTPREGIEQNEHVQYCTSCVKENRKTKCQSCGETQRLCKQPIALAELSSLSRPSIHQNVTGQKPVNIGLNAKNFYGSAHSKPSIDIVLKPDSVRWKQSPTNGKIGLSVEANITKGTKNMRLRNTRSSEPNDTIILSSDDEEDNASTGSTSRIESISPRPADSACSSPAPLSGKVEAALKENSFILEHKFSNNSPDPELITAVPRKARMKDQFGNAVPNTSIKRRKLNSEIPCEPMDTYSNVCESAILCCRSVRIGTFNKLLLEPVVFCLDFIRIQLEAPPEETGRSFQEITLTSSELTKSEWCPVKKLPVVFLQTVPATCQSLRSQLGMSRENGTGWYDCKAANVEEQFIVLIFATALSDLESSVFEKILYDMGMKNSIDGFFSRISFEEANGRLVAYTKHSENIPARSPAQKENPPKNVVSEMRMKLRNATSQFYEEEDEVGDTHTVFVGPIEKLIVYPPPPAKGGISVTNEDLHCLNEGEFLNDVIIDFYLKYLVLEKLKKDADRIHMFSSFFYKRLNQRDRRTQDNANLTLQQKRHGRVKTWTRHVDIFQKDFIFVPLNEAAHWFLAVICFPGLEKPEYCPNPYYQGSASNLAPTPTVEGEKSSASSQSSSETCLTGNTSKPTPKKTPSKKPSHALSDPGPGTEESNTPGHRRSHCIGRNKSRKSDQGLQETDISLKSVFSEMDSSTKDVNGLTNICKTPMKAIDGLHRIQISYKDEPDETKKAEEDFIDFSDDQDNMDESSEDGSLADDSYTSEAGKWHLKPSICKQPCILLMDSLRGPSRSTVVKTLREYLEVEWEVRKGTKRSFSKEFMKGSNPRVPQQNNFSDCGVYILQYVESFFENPIQSFDLPMNLTDWFPQQRMKTKREEIRNLILELQELQGKDKKGHRDLATTQTTTPQERTEQFPCTSSD